MTPFYNMLKPDEFELLKDVFYFCRLEEQGLDAEVTRDVARTIPLNRIAEAVRALGWFPTEQQVEELLTEIKFSQFHKTQKQVKEIELDDFIKFYVNHKPGMFSKSNKNIPKIIKSTLNSKKIVSSKFFIQ